MFSLTAIFEINFYFRRRNVMKLAIKAYAVTLVLLMLVFAVPAQKGLSEKDDRNTAPTVGTGGAQGGPTGLFTVYDAKTL